MNLGRQLFQQVTQQVTDHVTQQFAERVSARVVTRVVAAVAGVAAGAAVAAAGVAALLGTRKGDEQLQAQWDNMARYRYAHRGLHDNDTAAPENSLAAFRAAREAGYGSELDVHLTADKQLAVIHDSALERVTGEPGTVEHHTMEQLGQLRIFGSEQTVPRFGAVLDLYQNAGWGAVPPLIVEVKTSEDDVAPLMERVMAELDAHSVPYCVESFDPRVLRWLRAQRPEVMRGQLSEDYARSGAQANTGRLLGFALTNLLFNGLTRPDFIAYCVQDLGKLAPNIACGPLGGHLVTWTVRSMEQLEETEARGGISIFEGILPDPSRATEVAAAEPETTAADSASAEAEAAAPEAAPEPEAVQRP